MLLEYIYIFFLAYLVGFHVQAPLNMVACSTLFTLNLTPVGVGNL